MASVPQEAGMPLLYRQLEPLSSTVHGDKRMRPLTDASFIGEVHAIPLTVEEFAFAQRHYPIVFSAGDPAVPLALMGLNDGVNTFVGADGRFPDDTYVPAYLRRYPFLLARLRPDGDELSLCFDPGAGAVQDEEGDPLFEDGQPSQATKTILDFCEKFEQAAMMTASFVKELEEYKLLMDGEVTIKRDDNGQSYTYRGFRMVNEEALRELRGDQLRKLSQNGALPLIYAHMFSLALMREIFARQVAQGKLPAADAPAPAPVFQPAF